MTRLTELFRTTALSHKNHRGSLLVPNRIKEPQAVTPLSSKYAIGSEASQRTISSFISHARTKRESTHTTQPSASSSGDTLDPNFIIKIAVSASVVLVLIIVMALMTCFLCRRRSRRKASRDRASSSSGISTMSSTMSLPETAQHTMPIAPNNINSGDVQTNDSLSTNHHMTNSSSSKSFASVFGPNHDIKNFSRPMSPLVEPEGKESESKADVSHHPLDQLASSPTDNEVFTAAFQSMIGMEDKPESDGASEDTPNLHFSETFGKWTPRWDSRQSVQISFPKPPRRDSYLQDDQADQRKMDENFLMVMDNGQFTRSSIASSFSTTNTSILDPFDKSTRFDGYDVHPIPSTKPVLEHDTSNVKVEVTAAPEIDLSLPLRSNGPDNVTEQIILRDIDPDEPLIYLSSKSSTLGSGSDNYMCEAPAKTTNTDSCVAPSSEVLEEPEIVVHPSSPPTSPEKKQMRTRAILNLSMDDLNALANTMQQHRDSWSQPSPVHDMKQDLDSDVRMSTTHSVMISRPPSTLSVLGRSATYPVDDTAVDDILDTITEYSRESLYTLYEHQQDLQVPQQSHSRSLSASSRTPELSIYITPPTSPRYSTGSMLSPMPRGLTQSRPLSPIPELDSQYDRDRSYF